GGKGGTEREPDEAAGQGGKEEQRAEGGGLRAGRAALGAKERARRARAHEPRFGIDPLKRRRAEIPHRVALRPELEAARGRRDLPRQPEQERGAAPVQDRQRDRMAEHEPAEAGRPEDPPPSPSAL